MIKNTQHMRHIRHLDSHKGRFTVPNIAEINRKRTDCRCIYPGNRMKSLFRWTRQGSKEEKASLTTNKRETRRATVQMSVLWLLPMAQATVFLLCHCRWKHHVGWLVLEHPLLHLPQVEESQGKVLGKLVLFASKQGGEANFTMWDLKLRSKKPETSWQHPRM